MTITGQNFEVYQGDNKQLIITVYDENGAILPLTGYSAVWVAVQQTSFATVLSKSTESGGGISIPDPDNGQLVVELDKEDTASLSPKLYNHQCEIEDSSGNHSTVTTGYMKVIKSVTHSEL